MNIRNILLVAATRAELEPLLSNLSVGSLQTGRVTPVMVKQMPLDILITGPGMVATAYYMGKIRGFREYSLVLNAGIAGSFTETFRTGEVVHVTTDCFPEIGAIQKEQFQPLYGMPMAEPYRPPFINAENIIHFDNIPLIPAIAALPTAKGITVNNVTGRAWSGSKSGLDYQPDIETMEGAAFFFACKAADVSCVQIRAISNRIGTTPPEPWDIPAAVASLSTTLIQIINEL